MALAKITFYGIDECGYFARQNERTSLFGDPLMLLNQYRLWAKDGEKTLAETCTYHPKENSHLLRTFCYDCIHDPVTGDHLLVTWNESPSFDGSVAHVPENGRVGDSVVSNVDLPSGAVPGFPTYFYFIPSQRVYATLRFNSPLNGNAGLQKLFKEFLAKFTSHCVHASDEAEQGKVRILGYRKDEFDELRHLYPRFSTSLLRQPALIEYIKGSREKISKIHRKNLLISGSRPESEDDLSVFARLFRAFGSRPTEPRGDVRVTYEMQVTPTEPELNAIIASWADGMSQERTAWEDVGFQLSGEQNVRWLSSALVKVEPDLQLRPDGNEMVDLGELFAELTRIRPMLLRVVNARHNGIKGD